MRRRLQSSVKTLHLSGRPKSSWKRHQERHGAQEVGSVFLRCALEVLTARPVLVARLAPSSRMSQDSYVSRSLDSSCANIDGTPPISIFRSSPSYTYYLAPPAIAVAGCAWVEFSHHMTGAKCRGIRCPSTGYVEMRCRSRPGGTKPFPGLTMTRSG